MEASDYVVFNVGHKIHTVERGLLDKYSSSVLATMVRNSNINHETDCICIDRDGTLFGKVLAFMHDVNALPFHRMSNVEMELLKDEADFYMIETLVLKINENLENLNYSEVDVVFDIDSLEQILFEETRYVILLEYKTFIIYTEGSSVTRQLLPLIDRNKCLVLGVSGYFTHFTDVKESSEDEEQIYEKPYIALLYDPNKDEIVFKSQEADSLANLFYYSYFSISGVKLTEEDRGDAQSSALEAAQKDKSLKKQDKMLELRKHFVPILFRQNWPPAKSD